MEATLNAHCLLTGARHESTITVRNMGSHDATIAMLRQATETVLEYRGFGGPSVSWALTILNGSITLAYHSAER